MLHCPFCGTAVKSNETFCIKCGKELPTDMNHRIKKVKTFNRFWYLPIFILLFFSISSGIYTLILKNNSANAKEKYELAEDSLLQEDFVKAQELFKQSLKLKKNFTPAAVSIEFMEDLFSIKQSMEEASVQLKDHQFKEALSLINDSESTLSIYQGTAVTQLIDEIEAFRSEIKIEQLKQELDNDPNINELKLLIWDAEAINTPEAMEVATNIRNQIIDYVFSVASEQLNNNQFNNAEKIVDDGLKYAPDSEKLQSLKTTINKEQTTFETLQQQRIEQAITMATEESELNKKDAITLDHVKIGNDDQGNVVVKGEVTSDATIPVNSILVEYEIVNEKDTNILTNKVFVYPDKLYPEENGKFEFTHYDLDGQTKKLKAKIIKITWYTD